jgi:holo-[acyl-carrier protein] synthase
MAIVGMGTDIVEIERIKTALSRTGDKLAQRILTEKEKVMFDQHHHPERFLAKRFSAKEAASKALGTGIAKGVSFQDFTILNDQQGKPLLTMNGKAAAVAQQLGVNAIHISISDEKHYATATVILEAL